MDHLDNKEKESKDQVAIVILSSPSSFIILPSDSFFQLEIVGIICDAGISIISV